MDCKRLINTKNDSIRETASSISSIRQKIKLNAAFALKQQQKNLAPLNLKSFKPQFDENPHIQQNKIQSKPNSIHLNLFRPNSASKEDIIKQFINMRNIKLIKQNIKKLEQKLPSPQFSFRNTKIKLDNDFPLKNDHKLQQKLKKRSQSHQEVFRFKIQNLQHCRKLSHRFDRSKYFTCQTEKKSNSVLHNKQKIQQKSNETKQCESKPKVIKNYAFFDEIIPVIRQKSSLPKTAGGFLKKYSTQRPILIQNLSFSQQEQQSLQQT